MKSSLIVKNFGPIDFVDLDLRKVNVFIGPQASGKSALAKLLTILKAPRNFFRPIDQRKADYEYTSHSFLNILEAYNISSFLKPNTEIDFTAETHHVKYSEGKLIYAPKLLNTINEIGLLKSNFTANTAQLRELIKEIDKKFIAIKFMIAGIPVKGNDMLFIPSLAENFSEEKLDVIIAALKETEANLSANAALYIPSERNFINIIKNANLNLIDNNVPTPKYFLAFGAEMERCILHHDGIIEHRSFVIEEPELNLFPLAQYELIKKLESTWTGALWEDHGAMHTYTTHSPYILAALNNLLCADRVISTGRFMHKQTGMSNDELTKIEDAVLQVMPYQINQYYFAAYQICDGRAEPILDRSSGLIMNNYIAETSGSLADDFNALLNIEKQFSDF